MVDREEFIALLLLCGWQEERKVYTGMHAPYRNFRPRVWGSDTDRPRILIAIDADYVSVWRRYGSANYKGGIAGAADFFKQGQCNG